jgi:mRNA interferase RelE/StbE
MASYRVISKPSLERDLRTIPKSTLVRVMKCLEALTNNPFPRQTTKLEGGEGLYRIRVGDYRVIYGVDRDAKVVTIHHVRHRREVYRKL